jgi:hypothetical protein
MKKVAFRKLVPRTCSARTNSVVAHALPGGRVPRGAGRQDNVPVVEPLDRSKDKSGNSRRRGNMRGVRLGELGTHRLHALGSISPQGTGGIGAEGHVYDLKGLSRPADRINRTEGLPCRLPEESTILGDQKDIVQKSDKTHYCLRRNSSTPPYACRRCVHPWDWRSAPGNP